MMEVEEEGGRGGRCWQRGRGGGAGGSPVSSRRDRSRSPLQRWRNVDEPDDGVPPPLRFNPRRTPGVQPPLDMGDPSPGDIFSHFYDVPVLRLLCECTNKNAEKNQQAGKKFTWTTISPGEMKQFIGLLIYMSVLELPKISDYWRQDTIFHVPFPAAVMTRDRFMAIWSNIHMSDPEKTAEEERKKGTEEYDHLHRVRPLMELIRRSCKAIYHPGQHISVNERMVATKPRINMKPNMKAKPTKWGLKFFVLADANGYTVDFMLYTGENKMVPGGEGLAFDVVTRLVDKGYLGSGHIVYTDNFYTSPLLFRHLSQQGFGACGTYRQGRIGVPTTPGNALTNQSSRGSIRWIRDGDLLFVKWMDTREVSLCSTVHPVYNGETVHRWQKTGDGQKRITVPRPTTVGEYSRYMGGVETSDQVIGTNSMHRKTRGWPMTIFQHLLDIAVTNSYILHETQSTNMQARPLTRQQFQEELAAHLLGVTLKTGQPNPPPPPTRHHLPVPCSSGQTKGQRASMGRRRCKLCSRNTPWKCDVCDVGLCLVPDRNCYWQYHQNL
ncbi:piggyBac transposable element-derived protein 4-like [Engraulis encrasicolus]|uniref:piggyBac transposable element-derived protein 4-like n=1 Tax=Engraulis encrasicolus TaxID=184585 RepID=UPI002FD6B63B